MPKPDNRPSDQSQKKPNSVKFRKLPANHGSLWLTQAFKLFASTPGVWIGIAAFLLLLMALPTINNLTAILMPLMIGGIMIGCQQQNSGDPVKFDHLFSGLQSDRKQLLLLCFWYAIGSLLILLLTYLILLGFGIDYFKVLADIQPPQNAQLSETQLMEWLASLNLQKLLPLFLGLLISLALMIPLLMGFWFAPALVTLKKMNAVESLVVSYHACVANWIPYLIYGLVAFAYITFYLFFSSILLSLIPIVGVLALFAGLFSLYAITLISVYTSFVDIFECNPNHKKSHDDYDQSDSAMLA